MTDGITGTHTLTDMDAKAAADAVLHLHASSYIVLTSLAQYWQCLKGTIVPLLQGLPRGRETELFAQDLLDRLPSTNGSARPSQTQLQERQVDVLHPSAVI